MVSLAYLLATIVLAAAESPLPLDLHSTCAPAIADDGDLCRYLEFLTMSEDARRHSRPRPRPEIGGQRITEDWVREQMDTTLLWAFQYSLIAILRPYKVCNQQRLIRMTANELLAMADALGLPDEIVLPGGSKFISIEALCLTCACLRLR